MPIVDFTKPEPWDDVSRIWRIRARTTDINSPLYRTRVKLPFCRHVIMAENRGNRAKNLPKNLNIQDGDRVLLFGDVYGWGAEAFEEVHPNVTWVACDDNPLTQARKTQTETALVASRIAAAGLTGAAADAALAELDDGLPRARRDVLDEDAGRNGSRNRIRNELGGDPTHIITVGMLNFMFDAEIVDLGNRLRAMNPGRLAHIVNPFDARAKDGEPRPILNWKHISEDKPRRDEVDADPGIEARSWKALLPNDWIVPHNSRYSAHF